MKIKVRNRTSVKEGGQQKIVAELVIELTPDDVKEATPGRMTEDFYRNFGEDIIEAIHQYKPYGRI